MKDYMSTASKTPVPFQCISSEARQCFASLQAVHGKDTINGGTCNTRWQLYGVSTLGTCICNEGLPL